MAEFVAVFQEADRRRRISFYPVRRPCLISPVARRAPPGHDDAYQPDTEGDWGLKAPPLSLSVAWETNV